MALARHMHGGTWQRKSVPNRSKVTVPMRYTVPSRVDWVDIAKGICIILVVLMHSTLGVEKAVGADGWLHGLVAFARPFRIPAFFLIAGLFLARRIDQPWRAYADSKVLHFAYFYVLWLVIQCLVKCGLEAERWDLVPLHMLEGLVQPYGTLWFIYMLPVFFVATRLLRDVPAPVVLVGAAMLQIAPIETGWLPVDEFADRFVFFYAGHALAPFIFRFAETVRSDHRPAAAALLVWAVINGIAVWAGVAGLPGVALALGAAGAAAVVAASVLLVPTIAAVPLRYCGAHSIVIYLAFVLPMAATRIALVATGLVPDVGTMSLIVTVVAVTGPLMLERIVRGTRLDLLFVRPAWARLGDRRTLVAADSGVAE
jgi:uncharacterized membrane protein YcfT